MRLFLILNRFRGENPAAKRIVAQWTAQGGSESSLEQQPAQVIREKYDDGKKLYAEAILGWGMKSKS